MDVPCDPSRAPFPVASSSGPGRPTRVLHAQLSQRRRPRFEIRGGCLINLPASSLLAWVLEVVLLLHLQPQLLSAWGQLSPSAPSGWAWSLPPVVAGPGMLASPKWVHGTVLFSLSLICPFVINPLQLPLRVFPASPRTQKLKWALERTPSIGCGDTGCPVVSHIVVLALGM